MRHPEVMTFLCSALVLFSCSVKEDRDICPCRIVLDMTEVDTSVINYAELVISTSDKFLMRETFSAADLGDEYTVLVPSGDVAVGLYCGADDCVDDAGGLDIAYGDECPQVYMHSSFVKAEGEVVVEKVLMRKNHCIMTIQVETGKGFPFRLDARGNVDGYEPGGIPSEGSFMYEMHADADGVCSLILPRQTDDSLVLEVQDDTGVLKTFALGEYVAASGYDWNEADLRDITVCLDYSLTRVVVSVAGWNEEYVFDVAI
jgi:hypothetical protein